MICPSCNTPNRDDAKFCKKCGQPLRTEVAKVPEAAGVNQIPVQESTDTAEDISTAPTQIISPQQMMAFHASRWQKDLEQGQANIQASQTVQTTTAADQATSGATDIPAQQQPAQTPRSPQWPMPSHTQDELAPDIADMPTLTINPSAGNEAIPIPPPPPPLVDAEVTPMPSSPSMVEVVAPEVAGMTGEEAT